MRNLSRIGYLLQEQGVPWYSDSSRYHQINEMPPAPPWVERISQASAWSVWVWSPWLIPVAVSVVLAVILLPLGIVMGVGLWKFVVVPLTVLLSCAPLVWQKAHIDLNTHLYEIHGHGGVRYFAEATFLGEGEMRARLVAVDTPIKVEL